MEQHHALVVPLVCQPQCWECTDWRREVSVNPPWCSLATLLQLRALRVWRGPRASDSLDYTCIRRQHWLSCLFWFLIITSRLSSSVESQMAPQEPPSDAPRFLGTSLRVQCVLPGAVMPWQGLTFGGNEEAMKDSCCWFVSWLEAVTQPSL